MKKLLTVILASGLLLISVVSCSQESSTTPSEVKSEDEARGAALSYIEVSYEETTPPAEGNWQGKDVTPEGLLGRRTVEFTLDDWEVLVSSPVVAPENITYEVTVRNTETNWFWRGIVEPDGDVSESVPFQQVTQDMSRQIAEEFIKNNPTFQFDGIEDTLKYIDTVTLRTPFGWQFRFEFQSRQAGYGDRTGQVLAQVITPHTALITVIRAEVVTATLDEKWNMLEQKMISSGISEEESRQIAEDFVRNSPTFQFDGITESITLVETLYPDIENSWQFVFRFESSHAGYGDRTGQMLAQVITPHEAIITVEQGEVKNGVMDEKWDMLNQQMLEEKEVSLAPIHEVDVNFMESYPVQVGVRIQGGLRDGCTTFLDAVVSQEGDTINIEVTVQRPTDAICTQVYGYFEENLNLGSDFTTGTTYTINVNDYMTTFVYQ